MTLAVVWTRPTTGPLHELVVASDSRLTSSGHVDICQKIFPLLRGDCFLAFCGDTALAFPLIFQVQASIQNFRPAVERRQDITQLLPQILQLINAYRYAWQDYDDVVVDIENTTTKFLFGGWSWIFGKFFIYPIHFDKKTQSFHAYTHSSVVARLGLKRGEQCIAIGNYTAEFNARLRQVISEKALTSLNYEPLHVLAEMLRTSKFIDRRSADSFYMSRDKAREIGGAPQVIKIYQYANYRPIAIRWPDESGTMGVTLFGRPLFDYETTLHRVYDISENCFHYPLGDVRTWPTEPPDAPIADDS
jgi:hypothetical protein